MLEIQTGNEVTLRPISSTDHRLQGEIILRNTLRDQCIGFKIKCNNTYLFDATPTQGMIRSQQKTCILILTLEEITAESAKAIAEKNKFLIEFVAVEGNYASVTEISELMKGPAVQGIKIYINASSARNLRDTERETLMLHPRESLTGPPRKSAQSMPIGLSSSPLELQDTALTDDSKLQKLKTESESLKRKRMTLYSQIDRVKGRKGNSNVLKFIVVGVLGLIAGNFGSKASGLPRAILSNFQEQAPHKEKQEEEGFLSIFNIGGDQPAPASESWLNVL